MRRKNRQTKNGGAEGGAEGGRRCAREAHGEAGEEPVKEDWARGKNGRETVDEESRR